MPSIDTSLGAPLIDSLSRRQNLERLHGSKDDLILVSSKGGTEQAPRRKPPSLMPRLGFHCEKVRQECNYQRVQQNPGVNKVA